MSNQVAIQKSRELKQFFDRPAVQAKIRELVDKNSASFATSIMQIANSNSMLLNADHTSILNAACMAATPYRLGRNHGKNSGRSGRPR